MLKKTFSAALTGIEAVPVEIEVNVTGTGEADSTAIVGLPDAAVRESRERVRSALLQSHYFAPKGFTLVNLAPADMKKEGASFDLPIALCMLSASGQIDGEKLSRCLILGELALDGSVRHVRGVVSIALLARQFPEIDIFIIPSENVKEASVAAQDKQVFSVDSLREAVAALEGGVPAIPPQSAAELFGEPDWSHLPDFQDIKGQQTAKRALEISAAGGHNVIFCGPPGSGKSMLAKRLPGILPPMTEEETLEISRIHSILGLLSAKMPLLKTRPFREPHHTVSDAGLLGGGSDPRPGEISLAHNGVLFLDELPEFKRTTLEVLRQPLEDGCVSVSRAAGSFVFPARFILIAAMNPCPCGHLGDRLHKCRCRVSQVQAYRSRISGPLLDRIDLHVEVPALTEDELVSAPVGESSSVIRERVICARQIQRQRFQGQGIFCNSQMTSPMVTKYCCLDDKLQTMIRHAISEFGLSARAYDRILRTARTIADLAGKENIGSQHLFEAISLRSLDRR